MKLKEIRKNANLTQLQLANECGCERSTIGKIETGAICPSVRLAKRIAKALNIDWTLLYEEEGEHEEDHSGHDGGCPGRTSANDQSRPAAESI